MKQPRYEVGQKVWLIKNSPLNPNTLEQYVWIIVSEAREIWSIHMSAHINIKGIESRETYHVGEYRQADVSEIFPTKKAAMEACKNRNKVNEEKK